MIPKFQLNSVQKRYEERIALDIDQLALCPGRVHMLMGANGSGKSTLLNVLAFLAKPDRGEVAFDGKLVSWKKAELNDLRKRVTLLHQSPYLFTGTVFGNVAFGLKVRDMRRAQICERVAESLDLVGLSGFEQRNVKQLSGGEARRVALARALAVQPEVLLFDEPLANLDKHSASVVDTIVASLAARGVTVVMATHDPRQAQHFAGDIIYLVDGRLVSPARSGTSAWDKTPLCQPSTMPAL